MKPFVIACFFSLATIQFVIPAEPVSLFDGKSFNGWDGDTKNIWRIEDGCLVGGSLTKKIPRNYFLATKKSYANFILRVQFKLLGDSKKGFVNSGVQIRSQRVPNDTEMIGYQCDLGDPNWWGSIYDESRRRKVLAQSDIEAIKKVLKRDDWNDYEVRAEGKRFRTYINGVLGVDYTEPDPKIPQEGRIGLQIHSGGPAEVWFRNIKIEELPATAAGEQFKGAAEPKQAIKRSPLSPEEQKAAFTLPPGFEIELVASEPDVGKPITVVWDAAGRMWTMTALEYPVDANEDPERSRALFAQGGKDRVLVFDNPYGPGPHKPRVFADKLAIPLGLLPFENGAYVQYGNSILFLHDMDGDGKADARSSILQGFGTQDSHLFVHQFTRGPGNWIYFAQGAFNRSNVKTKEGPVVPFNFCKMARIRPDGSNFEIVQVGFNNIWGFVINREGEMFIQEANDLGYPLAPLFIGANYPGTGMEKLKPYAPWEPALGNDFKMGGTGLSGLALCEDEDGWPAPYKGIFYVANPITQRIQTIRVHNNGPHYRLEKLPDFIRSSDEWFRPIAIHFGPDGCLYIVDWYNKIISHNEVPRNHPERDKTRGRIWRVRHKDQPRREIPNLAKATDAELLEHLKSANTWIGRTAWHKIVDRRARSLRRQLHEIVTSVNNPAAVRLRALWALEGMEETDPEVLQKLLKDPNRNIRREVVRVFGTQGFRLDSVTQAVGPLASDSDPQVRAEVIRTLGSNSARSSDLAILVGMAKEPIDGPRVHLVQGNQSAKIGAAHDRDFERYLIRGALEKHPAEVAAFLDSPAGQTLPLENRILATLALEPKASAARLIKLTRELRRPLNDEEWARLLENVETSEVAELVKKALQSPATRASALESFLRIRTQLDAAKVTPLLSDAVLSLWSGDAPSRDLAVRTAAAFRLTVLESKLAEVLNGNGDAGQKLAAVRALREMNSSRADLFFDLAKRSPPGDPLRAEALLALVSASNDKAASMFVQLAPNLSSRERKAGLDRLCNSRPGAQAVVKAFENETLSAGDLDGQLVEKLQIVIRNDPTLASLLERNASLVRPVLRLDGRLKGYVDTQITLAGPFTVETWVRLDPGVSNQDGILGEANVADFNFHDGRFRVWAGPVHHDAIVAKRAITPDMWTHVAVTRDASGYFKLFLNGELDSDQSKQVSETFSHLKVGYTLPPRGTAGVLTEFRVWDHARSAEAIRADFDRSFEGETRPKGLVHYFPGGGPWGTLRGSARIVRTTDFPPLVTAAEAKARESLFAKYRTLAEQSGDRARGLAVFTKNCANCHTAEGKGANIGPTLNGAGAMGTEALLRNLLTPSAGMEAGYRLFRLELVDGRVKDGFLVSQDAQALILRRPDSEDDRIPQKDIAQSGFTKRSVMPDGLLDGLTKEQVADLFAYLKSLK